MSILYKSAKKIAKWDETKTLFENGEILGVQYDQAWNIARRHKLKYKPEKLIRKFKKCKQT